MRLRGHDLRRDGEPALLEAHVAGEALLQAADVDAGGVELGVAFGGEEVETFAEFGEGGYAGGLGFVGADCHCPEDESVFNWCHGVGGCEGMLGERWVMRDAVIQKE